jgi:O-antigen/teichoic acid export membrane protein
VKHRKIYAGTLWNLAGNALPLAAGVYAIPKLIAAMGDVRFGLLTLLWALIGYFGIFDLGLGRAITQAVAEALGKREDAEVPVIFWTGVVALLALGGAGALALLYVVRPLLLRMSSVPPAMRGEFGHALAWAAAGVPFVTLASASRGMLEAHKRFGTLNLVRIPYGIATFIVPLLWPQGTRDLGVVAAQLVALRVIIAGVQHVACARHLDRAPLCCNGRTLTRLLRFGGWMTVTNVVSPLMNYMDRFIIGALVSVAVVAYYTTPHEMVMRVLIIPGALTTTLFPVFGQGLIEDRAVARALYERAAVATCIVLTCACAAVNAVGYDAMSLWLGPVFAGQARWVAVALTVGVLFNGVAYLPYALLQGAGDSRTTALAHVCECCVYLPMLALLVAKVGIVGAAIAWACRAFADFVILESLAGWRVGFASRRMYVSVVVGCGFVVGGIALLPSLAWRIVGLTTVAVAVLVGVSRRLVSTARRVSPGIVQC